MAEIGNTSGAAESAPVPPTQIVTADAQTAGLAATGNKNAADFNGSSKISSLADLREKAPELEKAMLQGIAMNIVHELRESEERRKKLAQEYKR